jgi:hypothetical protein
MSKWLNGSKAGIREVVLIDVYRRKPARFAQGLFTVAQTLRLLRANNPRPGRIFTPVKSASVPMTAKIPITGDSVKVPPGTKIRRSVCQQSRLEV